MAAETAFEYRQDLVLGLGFILLALVALRRARGNFRQSGSETVITTFYFLIFFTSLLRAVWFLIPSSVLRPGYAPEAVNAFDGDWVGTFASEVLVCVGSLSLFSVFILIVIYWADLLKKIFKDSAQPSRPMASFLTVVGSLAAVEAINAFLFLGNVYSSQGMILYTSCFLLVTSLVCSVEISRFSHRFRTVLQTLGAINQVSTEAQVRRIVRITITGNVFFVLSAACELAVAASLFVYYKKNKSFNLVFDTLWWDWYILIKHLAEWVILFLLLWILHSPGGGGGSRVAGDDGGFSYYDDDYFEVSMNGGEDDPYDDDDV